MTASADLAEVTGSAFRRFMRNWATGIAIVTSSLGAEPVGCTVNAFTSVSLSPPLLLISLYGRSRTLAAIMARGAFGVNVLGYRQRDLVERFATGTGDRFAGLPHCWEFDVPLIEGAEASAVCAVERIIDAADHVLVLGRPRRYELSGRGEPLIFFDGGYRSLHRRSE
jgi:3-hydroxy-9,10-secoandrosta-1,3,5(10)-triene-9,17-dione monooxygenase reductase component